MQWISRIWAAVLFCLFLASQSMAQEDVFKDFDRWSRLATQGESVIDAGGGPSGGLEALRSRIVEFRGEFDTIRSKSASRITALREQIAALGVPPEGEGAPSESAEVAAQRADLTEQLNAVLLPVQRAEAEFVRANALVGQIDHILRERQTELLLSVSPSPLNPIHWQPAVNDLVAAVQSIWRETAVQTQQNLWETTPVVVALALLGLVLIFRGRRWSVMIVEGLQRFGARGFGIWHFIVSLLRVLLPFAGLMVLSLAVISTQLLSIEAEEIIWTIAQMGGVMLLIRWVSERVFARDDEEVLVDLTPQDRGKVRFNVWVITLLLVLTALLTQLLEAGEPAVASKSVLLFVPLVIACMALFSIGRVLRGYVDQKSTGEHVGEVRASTLGRVVRAFGTGAIAVACISPLLLAVGYFKAATALMPPYIMTLALLGLVMVLQRFLADVYGVITGQGSAARDALMPVVFGLVLLMLVLPPLALVWGARVTDLTELWAAFGRGFAIGDSRISPSDFIAFAVIFVIGYVLTRLLQSALKTNVLPKTKMDIGGQNAVVSGLGYVGIFLAALAAITGAGIDLSSIAIVAGALSVGIGFGLQNIVSNFVSGIILLIERPISEGDWIEVGGQMGYVRDISVRSTRIETFDRTDVIVPNADLVSGTVTNYTRGNTVGRVIIPVGVAYGSDTREVDRLLREIAEAQPMVLANPPPSVVFIGIGASTYDFEIRAILRDVNWMLVVKNDINHAIVERFAEANIEMAFPQLDVWMRNPETLRPQAGPDLSANPKKGERA